MKIIGNLLQGDDAWHAHRATSRNASEAPVIMGESSFMTRQELLCQKATGYVPEVDPAKQRLFDRGHEAEAAARAALEDVMGEDFFPVVGTTDDGYLSASMDGLNMAGDTIFEHKLFNASLAEAVRHEDLPPMYFWQLEQQLLVSGAEKAIFVCSDGTAENWEQMEYRPVPGRAEKLLAAWEQFDEDLANYKPVEVIPAAVAAPISDLPALSVQIVGSVIASNLGEWQNIVAHRIESINTDLQTDQDFADAESMTKFLADGEKSLELVKKTAQSQAEPIDTLFRAIDDVHEMLRQKRLILEKLVKARKESIRTEIMQAGQSDLADYIKGLNKRLGRVLMPAIPADFAGAMKSKKTVDSLKNAVSTVLANAKIDADAAAARIEANLATLDELAKDFPALFPDIASIANKQQEDFTALVKTRIAEHKEAEAKRQAEVQQPAVAAAQPTPAAQPTEVIRTAKPLMATLDTTDRATAIIGLISAMNQDELKLVEHFCERIIAQRKVAA